MSIHSIQKYHQELERIIHFGGSRNESSIRVSFQNLINEYARQKDLMLIPEIALKTAAGNTVIPDGTLKDSLRQDWGYWESKDEADDIDEEIEKKLAKGYPNDNILFEDSATAVLIQGGKEVLRVSMKKPQALDKILNRFIKFERPEIKNFREAIEHFKEDIPKVTNTLREIMLEQGKSNKAFIAARKKFLKLCKGSINADVTLEDVREMIIQHILTEDIFNTIFDETQFHRENNIAHELERVINTFFKGQVKRDSLNNIKHYYQTIKAAAAGIVDHHEKQKFLKVVYETFYKSYNPKAADRLGVVYTPNEIVKFMIEGVDYLLDKHFEKALEDEHVHILDPATGTGTFICDIIDYIRKEKLEYKYKHELHSNEVAILPYYISNLNIEFTYQQKMGNYEEFVNHCFVDTLDNMGFLYRGKNMDIFTPFTEENSARIKKQNNQDISVVIGNPPYNANQANENDNNKNREYPEIDKRIKESFVKYSTAQKTKVYDMYARFYRWAIDRLDDKGIIAFITNRSFIDSRSFDGFRKCIQDEFQHVYIIDLGGDIRALSGKDGIFLNENHTIFGTAAAVGIAMMFLIKDASQKKENISINYIHPSDIRATRNEKLSYLAEHNFKDIPFDRIRPDKNNNWINIADNDWESLIPVCSKEVKAGKGKKSLFELFSLGVATNRDQWVYDFSEEKLETKIYFFIKKYNEFLNKQNFSWNHIIKWSEALKNNFTKNKSITFNKKLIIRANYRSFIKQYYYADSILSDRLTQNHYAMFGKNLNNDNKLITTMGDSSGKSFFVLGINIIPDLNFVSPASGGTRCLPLYVYDDDNKIENITDWGRNKFTRHYKITKISKEDIFHYVYAVLHNPSYHKKYKLNLKRDYPRIPFYKDFNQWRDWGKALMELHINYENQPLYDLQESTDDSIKKPKAKLKADKNTHKIILDEATTLSNIPPEAWEYKLGNRSALEWILDQYKEKKPRDPTIAEKFNTYKFADYKPEVIKLLKQVCTVSVETLKIIQQMEK